MTYRYQGLWRQLQAEKRRTQTADRIETVLSIRPEQVFSSRGKPLMKRGRPAQMVVPPGVYGLASGERKRIVRGDGSQLLVIASGGQ